jgi:hypothetical protein
MVCKYRESRYLVPAIGLAGLNLILLHRLLNSRRARRGFYLGLLLLTAAGLSAAHGQIASLRATTLEQRRVARTAIDSFPDSVRVYCYGASSPYYALYFGNSFAGEIYGELLQRLSPEPARIYFYNNFRKSYHTFAGSVPLGEILHQPGTVLYQSRPFTANDPIYAWPSDVPLKRVTGGRAEILYHMERRSE